MSEVRNPGFAGETGHFEGLSESDVRGTAYVGRRPLEGRAAGAAASYPYQIAERDPDAPLFEGPYRERLEKILSRYPDVRGALLPVLNMAQEVRGHVSPNGHSSHRGSRAVQTARPRAINRRCIRNRSAGGTHSAIASWEAADEPVGGIHRRRRPMRRTCVSTGRTGRPSEKQSTQAAVLTPTPRKPVR